MRRAIQAAWLAIPLLVSLFDGPDARACGGCFVPPPPSQSVDSVITAQRMIFSISKDQTTLYDEITYSGSPATFAWVLPMRRQVEVGLSADLLRSAIDHLTASTVAAPPKDCRPPPVCYTAPSGGGFGCGTCADALAVAARGVREIVQPCAEALRSGRSAAPACHGGATI